MPLQHAVRRRLALAQPHERLHLAGEAGRRRQHRVLAAEVAGLPAQHVAEQHRGLVVEVVAGGDDVVAVVERGRVEQVALREAARAAGRAAGGRGGAGDVVAVVGREVDLDAAVRPMRGRELARVRRRTRRSTRRSRARGRGRRPRSRARTRMSHSASESLPPDTATSTRSPGCEHVCECDRPAHLLVAVVEEVVAAERRVVAADVDDRRARLHTPALHRRRPLRPRSRAGSRPSASSARRRRG